MAEKNQSLTSFAEGVVSKKTPISTLLQKGLPQVVGSVFKVVSAATEMVIERDDNGDEVGEIPRGVYTIMPLSGEWARTMSTPLTVKTKGVESIFDAEQARQLLWTTKLLAFDNLRLWSIGGMEGLSADGARVVQLSQDEIKELMNR